MDYALFDAARAGFAQVVIVVRPELESLFVAHFERVRPSLPVRYAYQSTGQGPGGSATSPSPESKPRGTGEAVLAAGSLIRGPFAVANGDDFYGADAYRAVAEHLQRGGGHALVAYRLDRTLFGTGGVSRALCRVHRDGTLGSVEEVREVRRTPDRAIEGLGTDGRPVALDGSELVSMNLWAFQPDILPVLEAGFRRFLEKPARPDDEFLLPDAVGAGVAAGEITVSVLPTGAEAFGITFAGDQEGVRNRLAGLTAQGDYPENLGQQADRTGSGASPGLPEAMGDPACS